MEREPLAPYKARAHRLMPVPLQSGVKPPHSKKGNSRSLTTIRKRRDWVLFVRQGRRGMTACCGFALLATGAALRSSG